MRRARSPEEVEAALELRRQVFCVEQGVALEADRDGRDSDAEQVVAVRGSHVVGTLRLLCDSDPARLGRMVVSSALRGRGVGAQLLEEAERVVTQRGLHQIMLHAQVPARAVYERAGYRQLGDPFMEEGIEHVTMDKRLG